MLTAFSQMIGAIISILLRVKPWNEAKVSSHQIPDFYNVIPKRTLRKVKPHQKTSRNIQHWAKWSQRRPNIRSHCVLFYCRMVLSSLSINCCASREGVFFMKEPLRWHSAHSPSPPVVLRRLMSQRNSPLPF